MTRPGDIVLDPMMGSGTTVLEAFLLGRLGLGFDIDPLALLLGKTKVTSLDSGDVLRVSKEIVEKARRAVGEDRSGLENELMTRWMAKSRDFVKYWFAHDTQIDLLALIRETEHIPNPEIKTFCKLALSAVIITKSGGLSLALDLAQPRPHRAKIVLDPAGQVIVGNDLIDKYSRHNRLLTKRLRSPFEEFERRVQQNLRGLPLKRSARSQPYLTGLFCPELERFLPSIALADAQSLSLEDNSIDLIVTSPPYASNAIDYICHRFCVEFLWPIHYDE